MRGINSSNVDPARMATVATVAFFVTFAPVLCVLAQTDAHNLTGDCSGVDDQTKEVKVIEPKTTVKLKCDAADNNNVKPSFAESPFKVCTNAECSDPPKLSEYIKGATGKRDSNVEATIVINDLPPEKKTFYVQCGKSNPCYILVKVDASQPGGVTTGGPQSCATAGKAITIKISEEGSTAQFTCGDLTLYPLATDRVFAEDCKKEESLKDIVRSDKERVYTLTAKKKPPKKKWCYLCARSTVKPGHLGTASDYCLVHVESSSRTQPSSVIALAAMLPCVLAMLRIT